LPAGPGRYVGLPPGKHWPAPAGLFSYEIFGQSYATNQNPPQSANPPKMSEPPVSHSRPQACYSYLDKHTHTEVRKCFSPPIGGTSVSRGLRNVLK
jgi:hypothetical protein